MKFVVITGASKGLGLECARLLLHSGYGVVGIARVVSNSYSELMEKYPTACFFKPYDFSNIKKISELVREISLEFPCIYGLINNAAVGYDGVLATMYESEISEMININVVAPIILTKYISRRMLISRSGRIINISSIIASTGFNGLSVYAASKAALVGFTRSLARELGKAGITVNTLCPGYMKTDMTQGLEGDKLKTIERRSPLGHLATVTDVANMVVFLLSDSANNITGASFTIDAGSTA